MVPQRIKSYTSTCSSFTYYAVHQSNMVQQRTAQFSGAAQYSSAVITCTVQYSTVQYSTVQHSTVQYSTIKIYSEAVCHNTDLHHRSTPPTLTSGNAAQTCTASDHSAHCGRSEWHTLHQVSADPTLSLPNLLLGACWCLHQCDLCRCQCLSATWLTGSWEEEESEQTQPQVEREEEVECHGCDSVGGSADWEDPSG